jgi:4-hydroxybenzoate polyprenyltransferase
MLTLIRRTCDTLSVLALVSPIAMGAVALCYTTPDRAFDVAVGTMVLLLGGAIVALPLNAIAERIRDAEFERELRR